MKRTLTFLTLVAIAGCSAHPTAHDPTAAPPSPSPSASGSVTSSAAPSSSSTAAAAASSAPPTPGDQCTDDDLTVTNGDVQSANLLRRVLLTFTNSSTHECTLTGYPGADLVTAAGGVLVHVARRPAAAAHHLTLAPGDVAHADVQSYVIDTKTNDTCPRIGTLVITPPNGFVSHTMNAALPICSATVSSVS
ncbi:MAG TPA: DUF4232 domain-containing protein [Mycobacterium sp.]|nr:DUF4232 domain-containing protein [Mycobacterium sp.]